MIAKSSLVNVARWAAILVVSLLGIWQCVLLRVAKAHGQLSDVSPVLLHAARSWAYKESVSVDQIKVVDSEFLDTLFGNSQNRHSYVVGFDKMLVINSRQHFRIMIDGDGDGFFMGTIPLSDKVALITEAIPIERSNVHKPSSQTTNLKPANGKPSPSGNGEPTNNSRSVPRQPREGQPPAKLPIAP